MKGNDTMKKLLTILLALVLIVSAVACTTDNGAENENENEIVDGTNTETANDTVYENVNLEAVANYLYSGIAEDNRPMLMTMPLTAEDFEYFSFIPYEEGLEAVVSEPMIGAIAHSVVLVKADSAEKAKALAEAMKTNCNPRKWICVEADVVEGLTNGNIAMLLMTTSEGGMAETIKTNFASVNAENLETIAAEYEASLDEGVEDFVEDEFVEDEFVEDEFVDGDIAEPEVIVPDETVPEDDVVLSDPPAEMPEVEADVPAYSGEEDVDADVNVPAVMPEEDNMPAVMPEVTPEVETEEETPAVEDAGSIDELYALADKLYEGIDPENMPFVGTMELTEENFEYSAFIPYNASYLAVENSPMMGSQPHSVVIVKTGSEAEAAQVASDMEANANPRKWICVQAKSVKSAHKGNFAILVMTSVDVFPNETMDEAAAEEASYKASEERADIIIANFMANA